MYKILQFLGGRREVQLDQRSAAHADRDTPCWVIVTERDPSGPGPNNTRRTTHSGDISHMVETTKHCTNAVSAMQNGASSISTTSRARSTSRQSSEPSTVQPSRQRWPGAQRPISTTTRLPLPTSTSATTSHHHPRKRTMMDCLVESRMRQERPRRSRW